MRLVVLSGGIALAMLVGAGSGLAEDRDRGAGHAAQSEHRSGAHFRPEHGMILRDHAHSHHHNSFDDPHFHVETGALLPGHAPLYDLPHAFLEQVPSARTYRYSIVNNHRVVVDPHSRRIVHDFH